ncbi:MAG: cupin domain-containing protein [Alphaproteobacteria bacterium]
MAPPIRRVVTGHNAQGRSIFISDGPAPVVYSPPRNPNVSLTDLWLTHATPASNAGNADSTSAPLQLLPPKNGTVIRILELPPDKERDYSHTKDYFRGMGAGAGVLDETGKRHPGMHRTNTVDYIVILSGEIWALMDDSEVLLKAGDCLIQRGTNHAWSNRSDKPCRFVAVLIDAEPVPGVASGH